MGITTYVSPPPFVADRIPPELGKVVEFLNAQMRPAEVLAIEPANIRAAA
jgi:hypothetical protein